MADHAGGGGDLVEEHGAPDERKEGLKQQDGATGDRRHFVD